MPPHRADDKDADGLVSLLTPVIKGFLTDVGYDMTVKAQQIYGGHGYIEEWGHVPIYPRCPYCYDL